MKHKILLTSATLLCALSAFGQASLAPELRAPTPTAMERDVANTNAPSATTTASFLGSLYDILIGPGITNLSTLVYGTYTPSVKQWGGGVTLVRNVPLGGGVAAGMGMGFDWYANQAYSVSGQIGMSYATHPLAPLGGWWAGITMGPFTYVGLGTPIQSPDAAGNLETIAAGGMLVHLAKVAGGNLAVGGMYGTRSGIGAASGVFYGGLIDMTWSF